MRLIDNWREVALKSHAMWAQYLAVLFLILPDLFFYILGADTNPRIWWFAALFASVYGIVGRELAQGIDHTKARSPAWIVPLALIAVIGGAVWTMDRPAQTEVQIPDLGARDAYTLADFDAVAVPLVAKWEGEHRCGDDPSLHCAYLDRIASPPVWTACRGETRGIRRGMRFTDQQCDDMLARALHEYREGLHSYFSEDTKAARLTAERDAAYTSFAYNVGVAGAGGSTATKRLNAGDIAGGCHAIGWWNKSGSRVIRGLVNRRADETALCLRGLT